MNNFNLKFKTYLLWINHIFKSKCLNFFSAVNVAIPQGGLLFDRKTDFYDIIPRQYLPNMIIVSGKIKSEDLLIELSKAKIKFPVFVKPNVGFQGYLARRCEKIEDVITFISRYSSKIFLIQDFVDLENEYSVLYYRYPKSNRSGILSLIKRVYPNVIGDGRNILKNLILNYRNERLDKKEVIKKMSPQKLNNIPKLGEDIILDYRGNFVKGASIKNLSDSISTEMIQFFDNFFRDKEGLNFVRIDLKAKNLESVTLGDFIILEINGAKSESLHIYDESIKLGNKVEILKNHWKVFFEISEERIDIDKNILPSIYSSLKSFVALFRTIHLEGRLEYKISELRYGVLKFRPFHKSRNHYIPVLKNTIGEPWKNRKKGSF